MTTKPNPLAVMDAAKAQLIALGDDFGDAEEDQAHIDLIDSLAEARAAVAELVEAVSPVWEAVEPLLLLKRESIATPDDEDECERLEAIFDRLRAALAAFEQQP